MIALAFLYIALMLFIGAIIFLAMPGVKSFNSTPARESVMYKTAYWLFMAMFASFALTFIFAALGK